MIEMHEIKVGDLVAFCHYVRIPRVGKVLTINDYSIVVEVVGSRTWGAFYVDSDDGKHYNIGNYAYWIQALPE